LLIPSENKVILGSAKLECFLAKKAGINLLALEAPITLF